MTFTKKKASHIFILVTLHFYSACQCQTQSRGAPLIEPITVTVINSDYSMAYSYAAVLTSSQLTITSKGAIVGEKDSVLFSASIKQSEIMRNISNIDIESWNEHYSNNCIEDGSQITVKITKGPKQKSIHLSNFYHEDVGKIIRLINSLAPDKYKIWYDKEKLIEDYHECDNNSKRP